MATSFLITPLSNLSVLSVQWRFSKIYRPEIYNANSVAPKDYHPSLSHQDYSLTRVVYDREERSQLAIAQGKYTEESFISPYHDRLEQWSASYSA
nr:putative oxygenase MesX [Acetobacter okinawensis]